ncbi:MAG: RimK family alpha-L-glutamate ligase [Promethearchaeota archaeon]
MRVGIFSKSPHTETMSLIEAFKARSIKPSVFSPSNISVQLGLPYKSFREIRDTPEKFRPTLKAIDNEIINLSDYSGFLIRGGVRSSSFEQRMFRRNILHILDLLGKKLMNSPRSIELSADKCATSTLLQANGLPTPRTIVCETTKSAIKGFNELGGKVVVKPVYGSKGRGLIYLDEIGIAERIFFYLASINAVIYLQEFIKHPGRDIRVIVLGKEALCAMYRVSDHDWKTNIHAGGKPVYCPITDEIAELAIKSSEILGLELAGIDLLETKNGYTVLEANSQPGWSGMMKVQNIDIPGKIVDYFISTLKR